MTGMILAHPKRYRGYAEYSEYQKIRNAGSILNARNIQDRRTVRILGILDSEQYA